MKGPLIYPLYCKNDDEGPGCVSSSICWSMTFWTLENAVRRCRTVQMTAPCNRCHNRFALIVQAAVLWHEWNPSFKRLIAGACPARVWISCEGWGSFGWNHRQSGGIAGG